jgi:hypothetical protein
MVGPTDRVQRFGRLNQIVFIIPDSLPANRKHANEDTKPKAKSAATHCWVWL